MLLACGIRVEWPSEGAEFIAVDHAEVPLPRSILFYFDSYIVEDFPAHQTLIVANRCHSENLPAIALKLIGFFDFELPYNFQTRVTEA